MTNNLVKVGIENLLPESAFSSDMFDVIKKNEPSGKSIEIRELNKMRLCEHICKTAQAENFAGFKKTLKEIALAFI